VEKNRPVLLSDAVSRKYKSVGKINKKRIKEKSAHQQSIVYPIPSSAREK
jgi:hypothetical protein